MSEDKVRKTGPGDRKEPVASARRSKKYIKPDIISCSAEDLLEQLGTARACSFAGSVMNCPGPAGPGMPPEEMDKG